jgi:hypothetical protein
VSPVPFYAVEVAHEHRDWLRRLATSPDPQLAAHFRAEAELLTAELERIKREKERPHV